ncbi:MAG: hypothetical protein HQM12_05655 [SAR324 cluster bacterium]|nr:hypothetical protein [SAR324 cluster bacterium]
MVEEKKTELKQQINELIENDPDLLAYQQKIQGMLSSQATGTDQEYFASTTRDVSETWLEEFRQDVLDRQIKLEELQHKIQKRQEERIQRKA